MVLNIYFYVKVRTCERGKKEEESQRSKAEHLFLKITKMCTTEQPNRRS